MSKIYFASDFHLGLDVRYTSKERERQIIRWLDMIASDAAELYLVGDIFDFWFEYREVIPKGYSRLIGKLAQLRDAGLPIYLFTGNHDMWMFGYFEEELGIPIYRSPIERTFSGKKFLIGHGDGLGPGDRGYKFIKRVFASPVSQWLFARLHPNFAFSVAKYWSNKSRDNADDGFKGKEGEWLISFAHQILEDTYYDYFVFGHRHLPIWCQLDNGRSIYVNLGDWMTHNSYVYFDGSSLHLDFFENEHGQIIKV